MKKTDIQCLFLGKSATLYTDLVKYLHELHKPGKNLQFKLVDTEKKQISYALRKMSGAGIVFISEKVRFPVDVLSDLVWQNAPDALIVIVISGKKGTSSSKSYHKLINNNVSVLYLNDDSANTRLFLQCLLQTVQFKDEFRRCKRLLGVSEKRCQWLVESSHEAIAYITRDLHLYANASYLKMFNAKSIEELRSISIKDLIEEKEHPLFIRFLEKQLKHNDINYSLIISMKKTNGAVFRANIHLIPSVFKGNKCLQLWVSSLEKDVTREAVGQIAQTESKTNIDHGNINKDETIDNLPNPFAVLDEKKQDNASKIDSSVIIQDILKRKEATLSAKKLTLLKKNEQIDDHFLLSFSIDAEQKKAIENLLFRSHTDSSKKQQKVFWDKVKLSKLFDSLKKNTRLNRYLLVVIDIESISDEDFTQWFFSEVAKLGGKASRLVFILPSKLNAEQKSAAIEFSKMSKLHHCKIALKDYQISGKLLKLLKLVRPDYVCLSSDWIKKIEGQDKREIELGNAIRQLESNNIRVIASPGISVNMQKNFALAGASFCQEKVIK